MDTKVTKLMDLYNMQLHNAEPIVELIDEYIPKRSYTTEVLKRCKKKKIVVSDQVIRDVKSFRTKNPKILNVILEFARENEKAQKELESISTGN
jgi:hypothetical protein